MYDIYLFYYNIFGRSLRYYLLEVLVSIIFLLSKGCRPYGVSVLTIGYNEFEEIFEIYLSDPAGKL